MKRHPILFASSQLLAAGILAAAALPLAPAAPAHAAVTFTVDRNDDPDPTTAMACTDAPDDCSLRGAIIAANTADGPDTIIVPAGTYTLTRAGYGEDAASTGDLDITGEVTTNGAGARSTIVTGGPAPYDDRIFDIHPGATATITGLTITGGKPAVDFGGGVQNQGDLTLDKVAVTGNAADRTGGIYAVEGTVNLTNSTVSGNTATLLGGLTQSAGTATITNSTISGNQASLFGGGVTASDKMTIRNSTIASNRSGGRGGGIMTVVGADVHVRNTIVAGNFGSNCDTAQFNGVVRSQGNNVSSDGSCGFTEPSDKQRVNPRLGLLQNNGGPTDTRALLAGSPALDTGSSSGCPAADQRGVPRPQGMRCDVGAFERRNRRPVAHNDAYRGSEDTTLRVSPRGVLRNDRDPDGDSLRASVVRRPAKGRLSLNANGAFTYRPRRDFHGTVRFRYRASDAYGGRDTATVTIRIAARPG